MKSGDGDGGCGVKKNVDKVIIDGIIYSMKTSAATGIGGEVARAKKPFVLRVWFDRVAKFVDNLIVKYYYKGERLRPEVWAEIQQSMKDAEEGKNISPKFTNVDDMFKWLDSEKQ